MNRLGLPETESCECPAGAGPTATSKHIAALMLVLTEFSEKETLHIGESCTDTLQQFSRPRKRHTGINFVPFCVCFSVLKQL